MERLHREIKEAAVKILADNRWADSALTVIVARSKDFVKMLEDRNYDRLFYYLKNPREHHEFIMKDEYKRGCQKTIRLEKLVQELKQKLSGQLRFIKFEMKILEE